MDWITILKAQQTDFIARIKSGELLHCEKEGQHSELTVISGERLKQLRDFCWEMANKFKQQYDVKNIFFNNMKGKLGEEVVKIRLGDFVTEVDYEKYSGGDGKVDFILTSDSSIGIQVKTRYGNCDQVQWSIDREEIKKNAVLVCVFCQEEFSDIEKEYGLIIAGFLPTYMIKSAANEAIVGIDELLYPGGLRGYLESLESYDADKYISLDDDFLDKQDYKGTASQNTQVFYLSSNDARFYNNRGILHQDLDKYQDAIGYYTQAINLDPKFAIAYYNRGSVNLILGNKQAAIDDFNKAASIYKQVNNFNDYQKTLEQLKNIQCDDVDLISAVGMDYRKLRDYLAQGKWKEADEETYRVMLAVAKREKEGWFLYESIDNFPCTDLGTIDQLWVKYSNGKFGFSVQKIIYQGLAKTYDSKMWDQFIHKIGRYIYYEINESNYINPPEGYFPGSVGVIWLGWEEGVGYEFVEGWFDDYLFRHLVRRLEICKMYNIKSEKIYEPLIRGNTQVSDDYENNYH